MRHLQLQAQLFFHAGVVQAAGLFHEAQQHQGQGLVGCTARNAGGSGQAHQVSGQIEVVAHLQVGVIAHVDHALRLATPQGGSAGAGQIVGVDVVGVNVVLRQQHRGFLEQTLAWRATFAVLGVNAGDAQDAAAHAAAPKETHQPLGIDPALGAGGVRIHGTGFIDQLPLAVAIDACGGAIDQGLRQGAQAQGLQQSLCAGVALGVAALVAGGRGQVHHPLGQARQAAQAGWIV